MGGWGEAVVVSVIPVIVTKSDLILPFSAAALSQDNENPLKISV